MSPRKSESSERFPTPAPGNMRDNSPLPAPKPQKPVSHPRESLDGETIFAVGEDGDKFSDDDFDDDRDKSGETSKLTGKVD